MANGHDLTGQVFERLSAISFAGRVGKKQERVWDCLCSCGNTVVVRAYSLRSGNTKSCGCLALEVRTTHGKSYSPEYMTWQAMKSRCNDSNHAKYYMYGAVGIKVDSSWENSFEQFFTDMGTRPSRLHTIERRDGSLGYSKSNCVWADKETQANNTKSNRPLTYNGKTQNLSRWARELGINTTTLIHRLKRGQTVEEAFTLKLFQRP